MALAPSAAVAPAQREHFFRHRDAGGERVVDQTVEGPSPLEVAGKQAEKGDAGTTYEVHDAAPAKVRAGDVSADTFLCSGFMIGTLAAYGVDVNASIVGANGRDFTCMNPKGKVYPTTVKRLMDGEPEAVGRRRCLNSALAVGAPPHGAGAADGPARQRAAMTQPEPQPAWIAAWIDEILAEHAAGRPRKAMTTLMFRLDDLLGAEDFVGVGDALRALPVERLSASLLVGALTVTSPFRGCVLARGELFDRVRERLRVDLPDRWDRVLVGLD